MNHVNQTLISLICIASAMVVSAVSTADPITLIHEGRGTGRVGAMAFSETNFVITALGDTDNRFAIDSDIFDIFDIDHDFAQINMDGVGSFTFVTPTRTFVNQGAETVGFSRSSGPDLFDGPKNIAFATWDMLSSIGPLTGDGILIQWGFREPVETSGGTLFFDNAGMVVAKFTAILVPEPTGFSLANLLVAAVTLAYRSPRRFALKRCQEPLSRNQPAPTDEKGRKRGRKRDEKGARNRFHDLVALMYLEEPETREARPVELGSWLGGLACAVATLILFPTAQWLWDIVARIGA